MNQIRTSALIGLGALGILFGRKMPGVQVIADEARIARYAAQPVVCNGEECRFSYVTPAQGKPVDLLLVAVKATVLDQAIADMKNFVGPDTVILSVLNGTTSEEHIETAYLPHPVERGHRYGCHPQRPHTGVQPGRQDPVRRAGRC